MKENLLTEARWVKSSRSNGQANCVEVAHVPGHAGARDSKHPHGPVLVFGAADWAAFLRVV